MSEQTATPASGRPLKIAVYGICLNEEAFVDRFMDSCAGADLVVIADTGSTDGTVEKFRARGAIVHSISIKPWRFDHARNAALDLVPEDVDVCVSLDLDQVLDRRWREILDKSWRPESNHVYYTLSWARNHDGSPRSVLDNRIHARHGFAWRYPVHECIWAESGLAEHVLIIRHLRIDHQPDHAKSRSQYLPLLELAAQEEPDLPRHAHYLGREYLGLERYDEALAQFERQFALQPGPGGTERNISLRMAAQCRDGLGQPDAALALYRQAAEEERDLRGPQVDLAWALYQREMWAECYDVAVRAAGLINQVDNYGAASDTGVLPEDMAAICGWRLGHFEAALDYGRRALALAPGVERIRRNVEQMETTLAQRRPANQVAEAPGRGRVVLR